MSTKSREVIYGGRIIGAKIRAEDAREAAQKAIREADRAAAELWSIQMEACGGPAQRSPTIGQCLNGGYGCSIAITLFCYRGITGLVGCIVETTRMTHARHPALDLGGKMAYTDIAGPEFGNDAT
jgi:hypothetical protein